MRAFLVPCLNAFYLVAALWVFAMLGGCATIQMTTTCPATSTGVSFALAGSTIGNTAISMLGAGLTTAGLLAKQGATAPATTATMTYRYAPLFGADSGSLNCTEPPPAPMILTPGPPPSIIHG